jgi:hypothetical protein
MPLTSDELSTRIATFGKDLSALMLPMLREAGADATFAGLAGTLLAVAQASNISLDEALTRICILHASLVEPTS